MVKKLKPNYTRQLTELYGQHMHNFDRHDELMDDISYAITKRGYSTSKRISNVRSMIGSVGQDFNNTEREYIKNLVDKVESHVKGSKIKNQEAIMSDVTYIREYLSKEQNTAPTPAIHSGLAGITATATQGTGMIPWTNLYKIDRRPQKKNTGRSILAGVALGVLAFAVGASTFFGRDYTECTKRIKKETSIAAKAYSSNKQISPAPTDPAHTIKEAPPINLHPQPQRPSSYDYSKKPSPIAPRTITSEKSPAPIVDTPIRKPTQNFMPKNHAANPSPNANTYVSGNNSEYEYDPQTEMKKLRKTAPVTSSIVRKSPLIFNEQNQLYENPREMVPRTEADRTNLQQTPTKDRNFLGDADAYRINAISVDGSRNSLDNFGDSGTHLANAGKSLTNLLQPETMNPKTNTKKAWTAWGDFLWGGLQTIYSALDTVTLDSLPNLNDSTYRKQPFWFRTAVYAGRLPSNAKDAAVKTADIPGFGIPGSIINPSLDSAREVVGGAGDIAGGIVNVPRTIANYENKGFENEETLGNRIYDWLLPVPVKLGSNIARGDGFRNMLNDKQSVTNKGFLGTLLEEGGNIWLLHSGINELTKDNPVNKGEAPGRSGGSGVGNGMGRGGGAGIAP